MSAMPVGVAVVTGADRGLGYELVKGALGAGWRVFAGRYMTEWPELDRLRPQYDGLLELHDLDVASDESVRRFVRDISSQTEAVDVLINNAGMATAIDTFRGSIDFERIGQAYNVNAVGAVRTVGACLELMDRGSAKRLCFVSSEAASIALSKRVDNFGYCMTKTALNMAIRLMYNRLTREGYSFKVFHPGWMRSYFGGTRITQAPLEPAESAAYAVSYFLGESEDDERLAMVDYAGRELSF